MSLRLVYRNCKSHCDLYIASATSLRFIYRKCNVIAIYISQMQCDCDLYIANAKDIAIYISQVQCHCDLYIANAMSLRFIYRKCKRHCDLYIASAMSLRFIYRKCNVIVIYTSQAQSHCDLSRLIIVDLSIASRNFSLWFCDLEVLAGKAEMSNCCLQSGVKAGIFLKRQNNPRYGE